MRRYKYKDIYTFMGIYEGNERCDKEIVSSHKHLIKEMSRHGNDVNFDNNKLLYISYRLLRFAVINYAKELSKHYSYKSIKLKRNKNKTNELFDI